MPTDQVSTNSDLYNWIGSSGGSWGNAGNWQDVTTGTDPATEVPGANDPVTIIGFTGAIYEVITGGGNSASLEATGYVDLSGVYGTGDLAVGSVTGAPGSAAFTTGGLAVAAGSVVTATTVGVLDGSITLSGLGADLTASGAMTVGEPEGDDLPIAGQTYSYSGGASGTLTLDAGATASVASLDVANGSVSVGGSGTSLTVDGALSLGIAAPTTYVAGTPYYYGESGSLSVTNGASVAVAGAITTANSSYYYDNTITVSGTGSSLTAGGTLTLSYSLDVETGGTVQLAGLILNNAASATVGVYVDSTSSLEVGSAGGAAVGAITVDAGKTIMVTTSAYLDGNVVDNGTISQTGGTLLVEGALSGSGQVQIGADSTLALNGTAAAGDTIAFDGSDAALTIGASYSYDYSTDTDVYTPYAVSAQLSGFATGDGIIFDNIQLTSAVYTLTGGNTGTLSLFVGGTAVETLSLQGDYSGQTFFVAPTTNNSGSAVVLLAAAAGGSSPVSTNSHLYNWIGSSGGSWGNAGNWQDVTTGADPATEVPGANDPVTIAGPAGSIYEVISGGGDSASLEATGYVDLSGAYGTGDLVVGSITGAPDTAAFTTGGLAVAAGSAVMATTVEVLDGSITLSGNDANLTASGAMTVGAPEGDDVPIAGQTYSYSGDASGTLTLDAGATASVASLDVANGSVSVDGSGTSLTADGALSLGITASTTYYGDIGSLSVTNGASVAVAGAITAAYSSYSYDDWITVSGTGSSLTAGGTLTLSSSLDVETGGTVQLAGLLLNINAFTTAEADVDSTSSLEVGSAGGAAVGAITVDAGNTITASASAYLEGNVTDNGTISETGGTLTLNGALSGSGQVQIGTNSTVELEGTAAAGDTIAFDGTDAALTIGASESDEDSTDTYVYTPYAVSAQLSGFASGDGIILDNTQLTNAVYTATGDNAGTLSLFAGGTAVETLSLQGNYSGETFFVAPTTNNSGSAVILLTASVGGSSPVSTNSDLYNWIGSSGGSWGSAGDWGDLTTGADPATEVPGSNDPVTITGPTGSIYEVITGGGNSASLQATGYVDLSGAYGTGDLVVGSVTGAPDTAAFTTGGLAVEAGSAVMATTVEVLDGSITLSGNDANLTASGAMTVGAPEGDDVPIAGQTYSYSGDASGTLTLDAGATASVASLDVANGSVSVDGSGTSLTVDGALSLGITASTTYYGDIGSLSVTNGASVAVAGAITIANDSYYYGNTITVSGTGSSLTAGGTLTLTYSLDIETGGTVQLAGLLLNNNASTTTEVEVEVDSASSLEVGSAGGAAVGAITVDAGNTITATTSAYLEGNVIDNGAISATGGTLIVEGALSGSGQVQIGADSTLALNGTAAAGDTIAFDGTDAALTIGASESYDYSTDTDVYTPYAVSSQLSGFATGDGIILDNIQLTSAVYTSTGDDTGSLSLFVGGTAVETLSLQGNYSSRVFLISPAVSGGSEVTLLPLLGTSVPPSVAVLAGMTMALTGFSITDPNASATSLTITLTDTSGLLSASNPGGGTVTGSGTNHLVISGTPAAADADLATLTYLSTTPGTDTIDLDAIDSLGATALQAAIAAAVVAPAPPTITPTTGELVTKPGVATPIGVSVADPDAAVAGETVIVTISDEIGLLSATIGVAGGGGTITGSGTTSLTITGIPTAVEADLSTLTYFSAAPGLDAVAFGASGTYGGAGTSTNMGVLTAGPPVITAPAAKSLLASQATAITGISLSESPAIIDEFFTVTLSDTSGLLSASDLGVSGLGTTSLTIAGYLNQVNSDLATLSDTDITTPSDTITITASDSLGDSATPQTIAIDVVMRPVISVPASATVGVGQPDPIAGVSLAEGGSASAETFTVTLSDVTGDLSANGSGVSGAGTTNLSITGSLSQVNSDLATLTDTDGTAGTDTITINASDSVGNAAARATIGVTVNGPPVITAPAATLVQGVAEPLSLGIVESGNTFGETFTATISDNNGLLSATGSGVTGSGTNSLTVTGSLSDVNSALGTLTDTDPTAVPDQVNVQVTDSFGNVGTASTSVTVAPLAPQFVAPSSLTIVEGSPTPLGVSLAEPDDFMGDSVTATVTDTDGVLSASSTSGASVVSSPGDHSLLITGSSQQVNAALATLTDSAATAESDTVDVSVADGAGDTAATTIDITVTSRGTPEATGDTLTQLFTAILAMDSYNRGYLPDVFGLSDAKDQPIGDASVQKKSADPITGFYALSYSLNGATIISYRGTNWNSLPNGTADALSGWPAGVGLLTLQTSEAASFYTDATGQTLTNGPAANVVLTGHSLGGGLAGYIASLTGDIANVFDTMPYGAPPLLANSCWKTSMP